MTRRATTHLLFAVLTVLACRDAPRTDARDTLKSGVSASQPAPPPHSDAERPQTRAERDSLLSELSRRRQQWLAAGIADYTLHWAFECFCAPPITRLRTEVRDGHIIATFDSTGHKARDEGTTVLDVFDEADSLARGHDEVVTVKFDSLLAYPTEILADRRVQVTDDQFQLLIKVEPLLKRHSAAAPR